MMSIISPACRHAVGTISSSDLSDPRRMVSEDSDQLDADRPFLLIVCTHRIVTPSFHRQITDGFRGRVGFTRVPSI